MLAKGWLLGIQFEELFQNRLFYDMASHANEMAGRLRRGIEDCGYSFHWASTTNQLFPVLPNTVMEAVIDDTHTCIRLVTSWATKPEAVDAFLKALQKLS